MPRNAGRSWRRTIVGRAPTLRGGVRSDEAGSHSSESAGWSRGRVARIDRAHRSAGVPPQ